MEVAILCNWCIKFIYLIATKLIVLSIIYMAYWTCMYFALLIIDGFPPIYLFLETNLIFYYLLLHGKIH